MMRRRRGPSLIGVAATTAVVAGTAGAVRGHQANKAADQQQQAAYEAQQQQAAMEAAAAQAVAQQQAAQPQYAPAPVAAPADDTMAQLQKYAQMKDQGILTEEEFTAMKAKLLGL
jgi:hypothetical protein